MLIMTVFWGQMSSRAAERRYDYTLLRDKQSAAELSDMLWELDGLDGITGGSHLKKRPDEVVEEALM